MSSPTCAAVILPRPNMTLTVIQREMKEVDRCKCEGITEGFAKITVAKNSGGKILGATVVGPNAGSMISELTICIQVRDFFFCHLSSLFCWVNFSKGAP